MRKTVLTYGLISGAMLAAMMSVSMLMHDRIGFENGMIVGYTTMVLAFLMIYFGVRSYRDNTLDGSVTFGRAFVVGLLIMIVSTACYVAAWQVMYHNFMPDYLEKYSAFALEQARAAGKTPAEIDAMAKEMAEFGEMYKNPLVNIAFTFLEPLPVGIPFTLVTAWIHSRRRAVSQPAMA